MVTTTNLVSYYKLDENAANTTVADSHGSNTGTSSTNTSNLSVAGKINDAFSFVSANSEKVAIADNSSLDILGQMSISAWIKRASTDTIHQILSKREATEQAGAWAFAILSGGQIQFTLYSGSAASQYTRATDTISDINWHHLVFTFDDTTHTSKIYVDGSEVSAYTNLITSNDLSATTHPMAIGFSGQSPEYSNGTSDEIALFDTTLSQQDITDLYNSGNGLAYPFTAVGTNMSINVGDAWKDVESLQINVGDVWKDVISIEQNIGDSWKVVY